MAEQKTQAQQLQEQLLLDPKNSTVIMPDEEIEQAYRFCDDYVTFLNRSKTERLAVQTTIQMLEKHGFIPYDSEKHYQPGDKVYLNNRGKAIIIATFGTKPLREGVRLVASHIDSPRLDLKPRPLFEETQLAFFKTHYYGGIKKYQWTAIPLSLHGVVVKKDGTAVDISIGDRPEDPVFTITDLLPHLASAQMKRTLSEAIKGEELDILIGSHSFRDDKASELVKLNIAKLIFDRYGILEEDFLSAELSAVPAFDARDLGLDRSMIGAYGHDDRVCAYTSLAAALEVTNPTYTSVTVLADKEETGSDGNTGLNSKYLEYFIHDLAAMEGCSPRAVLTNSKCLSADVNAAYDPKYKEVSERRNSCYLNYGVVVTKYTGSRGKGGTSDASAEFMGFVRGMLDEDKIIWQTGELGKVDEGGGGTVAKYIAALNVDVVDVGVPVLSMHSPFEIVAKTDVYSVYRAFCAFLK